MPMLPGNMTPNFAQQATMMPIDRCIQANPHCGLEGGMGTFSHKISGLLDNIGQQIKFGPGSSLPLIADKSNTTFYSPVIKPERPNTTFHSNPVILPKLEKPKTSYTDSFDLFRKPVTYYDPFQQPKKFY